MDVQTTSQAPLSSRFAHYPPAIREQIAERMQQRAKPRGVSAGASGRTGEYRFNPVRYIAEKLGWTPWAGHDADHPGQVEILDAYSLALRQQIERQKAENGESYDASIWHPGQVIKPRIRIESGDSNGKTRIAAGIVRHFFDCFPSSIAYTFAPSARQVRDLLWKFIKQDAAGRNLPGRVLDTCILKDPADAGHFAIGISTDNTAGLGRERIQGQHAPFTLIVIDEAPGVENYVYDAIPNLTSGGIYIILMVGNPTSTTTRFHKEATREDCINFRMDTAWHPNVLADREIIPGAATRRFVLSQITDHCELVDEHDPEAYTFSLAWEPALIYRPDSEYLNHVMGIAVARGNSRSLVPHARYLAAVARKPVSNDPHKLRLGLDCQRDGTDFGKLYANHNGAVWPAASFQTENTYEYSDKVKQVALELKRKSLGSKCASNVFRTVDDWKRVRDIGITSLHIRIDMGGGFGAGQFDHLKADDELIAAFPDFQVIAVHFGSKATKPEKFYDCITELTADFAESLKTLTLLRSPATLEADLTERLYEWRNVNVGGKNREVKKLEKKDEFRKRHSGRSPDDGDACVMAGASDSLFTPQKKRIQFVV